jgi:hypothetical protein
MSLSFDNYIQRLKTRHGDKFDDSQLAHKFRPYFGRDQQRIKVRFPSGETRSGTVSGTTGWRPSLMLMLRRNSTGSSWLLDDRCEIIGFARRA